jgi:hypothetical protein
MNTQLKEGIERWKAGEFERMLQRYVSQNHDPSAPENQRQLKEHNDGNNMPPHRQSARQMSWHQYARSMGVPVGIVVPVRIRDEVRRAA